MNFAVINGNVAKNYFIDKDGNPWSTNRGNTLKPLKPDYNSTVGYPQIKFTIGDKRHSLLLHRVVAETLVPFPKPEGITQKVWDNTDISVKKAFCKQYLVNHKDHDKSNYHPSNLEWVSFKGNAKAYQKHSKKGFTVKLAEPTFKSLDQY